MERSSKPPPGDFPAIGGRGQIDGSIEPARLVVLKGRPALPEEEYLIWYIAVHENGRLNLF